MSVSLVYMYLCLFISVYICSVFFCVTVPCSFFVPTYCVLSDSIFVTRSVQYTIALPGLFLFPSASFHSLAWPSLPCIFASTDLSGPSFCSDGNGALLSPAELLL